MAVDARLQARAEAMLNAAIAAWSPRPGGLTHAQTGVAELEGGRSVFLKIATDGHSGAEVAAEAAVLGAVTGSFLPRLVASDQAPPPMLAIEDLSEGHWPEPYPQDLSLLEAALAELRATEIPEGLDLPPLEPPSPGRWTGLASAALLGVPPLAAWLAEHEDALLGAIAGVGSGRSLVHGDLWYSNICFLPDRVVFVDWSHARVGSPWHDAATVSIDLVIEGRRPLEVEEGAAWAATYLAASVHNLAAGPGPGISRPEAWRTDVEELVDGAAWWVGDELDLSPPPQLTARRVGWR